MSTMSILALSALCLLSVTVSVSGDVSSQSGSVVSSRSFQAQGASLSQSVSPDGTEQGECTYSDSTGHRFRVLFHRSPGGSPQYQLVEGSDTLVAPAQAYQQCTEQYQRHQQENAAAFSTSVDQFVPFVGVGPVWGGFDDFGGPGAVGGNEVLGPRQDLPGAGEVGLHQDHAHFGDFNNFHQQIQNDHRRIMEQNLAMQQQIMQQILG